MQPRISAPFVAQLDKKSPTNEIAVVIPVYMGAAFLEELVERLHAELRTITDRYEIILVDDRGPDESWDKIQLCAEQDSRVTGIQLSQNFGQHPAISAGIAYANSDWYVVMDCDIQDPPECIGELFRTAVRDNLDIVVAERETSGLGARRNLGSALFNGILRWASDMDVSSRYGNFRIFSNKVANAIRAYPEQLRFFPALISHVGFSQGSILLPRNTRAEGKSSYSYRKLAKLALENIIAYSEKPLWISIAIAISACVLSGLYGVYVGLKALIFGFEVAGFATLTVLITFIGGLQLFMLSLVGLYVGRGIAEARHRPVFIVDQITKQTERD